MEKVIAKIDDMHCEHCQYIVEDALEATNGVQYANVTLEKDEVVIEFDKHKLQIAEISDAVANAGYDVRLYMVVEK
ncbi:hypothetical protein LCW_09175 [Latilactobacillus curvatus]|uniref:heavy-metal-associated domain-containing protein n=1 Tax=Latilactobacillus curvatus TaxID=28038 RepID=UPI00084A2241|nr:heavy-metal-associated domain-containing protein [Latilactobacillus curvatus]AOO76164.1 hypothetical protein LCW_09175 [Latilactobacillus curvatus]